MAGLHTRADAIRGAAEELASATLFETLGLFGQAQLPVPIEQIAALLVGLESRVVEETDGGKHGAFVGTGRSGAWIEHCELGDRENTILVSAQEPETRKRFTVAHEIGHFLFRRSGVKCINRRLDPNEAEVSPSSAEEERFANIVAGHLLLPEPAVAGVLRDLEQSADGLEAWSSASRRSGVSFPAMCVALADRKLPARSGWVLLVADWAVARARRTGLSLRVRAAATPAEWFLPKNRRLASIGLGALVGEIETRPAGTGSTWRGDLELIDRRTWKPVRQSVVGSFKKYRSRGGYTYAAVALRLETGAQTPAQIQST